MTDSLGLDEPPQAAAKDAPYRVLARKYRPQSFADLIGQDAMVTTLGNAIKRDRLAHAFLLTGVRGVGKTSTARLIAKALNCIGPDGQGGPTIAPCGVCEPCVAIAEGRHIDVIEMDAASHTGVDDVREIIESVRYAAVSARFKVYIVDEVHMLSKNAFNALLKTLEEPPPHVKFLFATTEVNKVPVTVLSRCQRFDLRRIPAELLATHFASVCAQEGVEAEPEALALIARAAEGSARDGLSILDQAIAHAAGLVTADQVRAMIGLADRGAIRRLLKSLLAGEVEAALAAVRDQYDLGVEPLSLLRGLLESVHAITRAKIGGAVDPAQSAEEREDYAEWAAALSYASIHRLWQLLLKGHGEVAAAALPLETAEMALLRVLHASELPDPGKLAGLIEGGSLAISGSAAPAKQGGGEQAPLLKMPADFRALLGTLEKQGRHQLVVTLHDDVGVARFAPPLLALKPLRRLDENFARDLTLALKDATGERWQIDLSEDSQAEPSLREQELEAERKVRQSVLDSPAVRAAMEAFPGAELTGYQFDQQRSA